MLQRFFFMFFSFFLSSLFQQMLGSDIFLVLHYFLGTPDPAI